MSYQEAQAAIPIILIGGAVIGAVALVTLAISNAIGYKPASESHYVTYGSALYKSFDSQDKSIIDGIVDTIYETNPLGQIGDGYVVKLSAEAFASMKARIEEFFNSIDNTYSIQERSWTELGVYSGGYQIAGIQGPGTVYALYPNGTSGVIFGLSEDNNLVYFDNGNAYISYKGNTPFSVSIGSGSFTYGLGNPANVITTDIPMDPDMDRKTTVPPLPIQLPQVAADGTTSIPLQQDAYVDSLPTDVVNDMATDVPVSITDALALPITVVPETTTTQPDLDQIQLPVSLKDKFPFCIPFDFLDSIAILRSNPKAPVFDWQFKIPSVGINQQIHLDLSIFDGLASVLRWFLSLLFTVLVIVATRRFIM